MSKPKQQKIVPTPLMAEFKHPKTGKLLRYPLVQVRNGADGNQVAHLVQLPNGDLAREQEVPEQFVRYVSNGNSTE